MVRKHNRDVRNRSFFGLLPCRPKGGSVCSVVKIHPSSLAWPPAGQHGARGDTESDFGVGLRTVSPTIPGGTRSVASVPPPPPPPLPPPFHHRTHRNRAGPCGRLRNLSSENFVFCGASRGTLKKQTIRPPIPPLSKTHTKKSPTHSVCSVTAFGRSVCSVVNPPPPHLCRSVSGGARICAIGGGDGGLRLRGGGAGVGWKTRAGKLQSIFKKIQNCHLTGGGGEYCKICAFFSRTRNSRFHGPVPGRAVVCQLDLVPKTFRPFPARGRDVHVWRGKQKQKFLRLIHEHQFNVYHGQHAVVRSWWICLDNGGNACLGRCQAPKYTAEPVPGHRCGV